MSIQQVNINNILIDNSWFSLEKYLFESREAQSFLVNSLDQSGILYPVVIYKDNKELLHLIDGRKRLQYAKQNNIQKINATILPEATPIADIIILILCNLRNHIESSIINKVQFICFAKSLNIPESWLLETLSVPLGLKTDAEFLSVCKRIYNMPGKIRIFCHEKKYSLKQLINLTCHSDNLLEQLAEWKSILHLTASTLDEIAVNLRDYLKAENRNMEDFLKEPDLLEILDSSLSPRDKTEKLRQLLYLKRFPTLSNVNNKIRDTIKKLNLPEQIIIKWDNTLENKNVDLNIHLNDPEKWNRLLDTLNSKEIKDALGLILNEL